MYNQQKAWDVVPDMSEARARSMKHLAALATSVVTEVLGPSPQAQQEAEDEEAYQRRVRYWRESVEQMRTMSEEDYRRAIDSGQPGPVPTRKGSERMQPELDEWLRRKIADRLMSKIDATLLSLIGIEQDFGGAFRMKSGFTPLGSRLADRAKAIAVELVDKWLEKHEQGVVKSVSLEGVERNFKYELDTATKKAVANRIAAIAKQRAENIRIEVLEEAVDRAMFNAFPVLRCMEAAERLGAKNEPEAR